MWQNLSVAWVRWRSFVALKAKAMKLLLRPSMLVLLWLLALTLSLTGCVHQPRSLSASCTLNAAPTLALLTISHAQQQSQILLSAQMEGENLVLVALNPVGARLFSGRLISGQISTEVAAHYRGADPALLLWGYSLWLTRTQAASCWPNKNLRLTQLPRTDLQLWRSTQVVAEWHADKAAELLLPEANLRIHTRIMN